MALCLGLTLILAIHVSGSVIVEARSALFRATCLFGIAFLFITQQWVFAVALLLAMSTAAFRKQVNDPTDSALQEASVWLVVCGALGFLDVLFPASRSPLSHPALSIGLTLWTAAMVGRRAIGRRSRA
jgi:hypothetical protein